MALNPGAAEFKPSSSTVAIPIAARSPAARGGRGAKAMDVTSAATAAAPAPKPQQQQAHAADDGFAFEDMFDLAGSRRCSVADAHDPSLPETPTDSGADGAVVGGVRDGARDVASVASADSGPPTPPRSSLRAGSAPPRPPALQTGDGGDGDAAVTAAAATATLSGAAAAAVAAAAAAAAIERAEVAAAAAELRADAAGPVEAGPATQATQAAARAAAAAAAAAADGAAAGAAAAAAARAAAATSAAAAKVGPSDFEILRVVGQGAFGKVFQVRHRATGDVYAMKVMRKERILARDHSDYVRAERDLLTGVSHPYIVALRYSFQTPSKLYLVLDFLNGGHLFFNLYREGVFAEDVARLYCAEIVLALSYLHAAGIVHRDLKPENVLLDAAGHVRLTDFGLAKGNMGGEGCRFIGTMEYMAPEVVEGSGHGKEVDWWSAGVLLYEMLAGVPPFRAKSRQVLQQQIVGAKVKFPKFLSSASLSLLKGLLVRDPAKRLGSGPGGSAAVMAHPFFKAVPWAKLAARQVESKFKPAVKSSLCVDNFDKIWTEQPPADSPCGTPTDPAMASAFEGFTYVGPSFMAAAASAAASMAALSVNGGGGGGSGGANCAAAAAATGAAAAPAAPAAGGTGGPAA